MNEEIRQTIQQTVENAVDTKINGKLVSITEHLKTQDLILVDVKKLLEDKKFLVQLWAFIKFLSGVIVSIGTAILLYKKLKL